MIHVSRMIIEMTISQAVAHRTRIFDNVLVSEATNLAW